MIISVLKTKEALLIPSPVVLIAIAPFAPFKASFKDPFKTRPPQGDKPLTYNILEFISLEYFWQPICFRLCLEYHGLQSVNSLE